MVGLSYVGRGYNGIVVIMSAVALLIGDSVALATAKGKLIYLAPIQACHNGFSRALLRSEG